MEKNIKISIIVPVFNTEKYLAKCLDSIINQTIREIEIICIDDGSTDTSLSILTKYQEKDNRIKVIKQQNKKQGAARNTGIKIAQGEYIGFIDSDDTVCSNYFEELYINAVNNNADISCSSIIRKRKFSSKYRLFYDKTVCVCDIDDKLKINTSKNGHFVWNVWNKIYRKSFIEKYNLNFEEDVFYEDVNFTINSIYNANKIITVPNIYYYYRVRFNSVVKGYQDSKKRQDLYQAYSKLYVFCKNNRLSSNFKNLYCNLIYFKILSIIVLSKKILFEKDCAKHSILLFNCIKIFEYTKKNYDIAYDYPIDLVYLWCDGSDEKFIQERDYWQKKEGIIKQENSLNCQWNNNDELKFSIRSVKKYAKWIRNIYIITNSQIPKWLKTDHRNISIIDIKDIMPADTIPTFNSQAIETCLHNIDGLSEHFLYANDDMFFNSYVNKDFFFNEEGKPIVRLQKPITKKALNKSLYAKTIYIAQEKVKEKHNVFINKAPHHCIDAYTKTIFKDCIQDFQNDFKTTVYQKFRNIDCLQRAIILYRAIALNQAILKYTKLFGLISIDSKCISMNCPTKIKYLNNKNIKLFCLNDDNRVTSKDRQIFIDFLENKFPQKSECEV